MSGTKGAQARENGKPRSIEDVIARGAMIGVPESDCRAWFTDMEACGWAKVDGTPFGNWPRELVIHRDRMRQRPTNTHASGSRNGDGGAAHPDRLSASQVEGLRNLKREKENQIGRTNKENEIRIKAEIAALDERLHRHAATYQHNGR